MRVTQSRGMLAAVCAAVSCALWLVGVASSGDEPAPNQWAMAFRVGPDVAKDGQVSVRFGLRKETKVRLAFVSSEGKKWEAAVIDDPKKALFMAPTHKLAAGDNILVLDTGEVPALDALAWVRVDVGPEDKVTVIQTLEVDPSLGKNFKIDYELGHNCNILLEAVRRKGGKAKELAKGPQKTGKHKNDWDAQNADAGSYFIRLSARPAGRSGESSMQVPVTVANP